MVLCPIGTQIIYNYGINQPIRMAALKPKPIPAYRQMTGVPVETVSAQFSQCTRFVEGSFY